jgi:hypothetical protein
MVLPKQSEINFSEKLIFKVTIGLFIQFNIYEHKMLLLTFSAFVFLLTCVLGFDVMLATFSFFLPVGCFIGGGVISIYAASYIFYSKFELDTEYSSEPSSKRCMMGLFAFICFMAFLLICGLIGSYYGIKIGFTFSRLLW